MAVGSNSYSTAAKVADEVPRYTDADTREFTTGTRPSLTQVESYINRVSGVVNLYLAKEDFAIPLTQSDAVLACEAVVIESVIDMCHAANSAGRFYQDKHLRGKSPLRVLRKELSDWVTANAAGFERLGAARTTSNAEQIGYRSEDESDDDTFPIFQRKGFGNQFTDWDND
ncbi:MAG: hypothetical protein U9N61_02815 [Euryarchaeota archaeon]|nr:hypothetical protein [Euryarchaeota archaeon]